MRRVHLFFSVLVLVGVAAFFLDGCGLFRHGPVGDALRARHLMVPVAGVAPGEVPDDFKASRGFGRIHGAVDILAPVGTPVVAADAGRVLRLSRNRKGGITLYATDETERFVYYYAHLNGYRTGIAKGTRLARGDVIGYVGHTGNADRREPHLHFQVMVRRDERWWNGDPVDPRPYFALAGRAQR